MIKLFGGKDTFESYKAAKKDAENLSVSLNAPLKIFNAAEITSIQDLIQEIEGVGMFAEVSVFLIKRISENKEIYAYFSDNYDKLKNQNIILWEDIAPDGKTKLVKNVKKDGALFVYDELKERDLKSWLTSYIKEKQLKLTTDQLNFLLQHSELSKGILENEIIKIELYLSHKKKGTLSDRELNEILGYTVKGNIWNFLDYFGNRKRRECLEEFTKLIAFEENSQYLIAMLARELNIIAQILYTQKEGKDLQSIKLHPFVLQKAKEKAKNFKWHETKLFLKKLLDLDFAIKRGDIDEKLGLTLYLLSI